MFSISKFDTFYALQIFDIFLRDPVQISVQVQLLIFCTSLTVPCQSCWYKKNHVFLAFFYFLMKCARTRSVSAPNRIVLKIPILVGRYITVKYFEILWNIWIRIPWRISVPRFQSLILFLRKQSTFVLQSCGIINSVEYTQ